MIYTRSSGAWTTVTDGSDVSLTGLGSDRPNLVGNPNNGPKTVKTWFNTAVYQKQAAGTFVNSSRNDLLGPSVSNVDTGAWRSFNPEKSLKLEMRVDAFNVFNPYPG